MEFVMEKIYERDIDLLIMSKFLNEKGFLNYICNKIGLVDDYKVINVSHSVMNEDGETDVTVLLQSKNEKIAFLIENKIDAIAMPSQRERYDLRGEKGIKNNEYNRFFVLIIAPQEYLNTNFEAKKYENQISYENLINSFENDFFAKSLLKQAIKEKKRGYIPIENNSITKFWNKYYDYVETNYPLLSINRVKGPRGSKAVWPYFILPIDHVCIVHKSEKGYVDLSFSGLGEKYIEFYNLVKNILDNDMLVSRAKKSIVIRLHVPIIDFNQPFDVYIKEMKICIESVLRLNNLLLKLNIEDINKLY